MKKLLISLVAMMIATVSFAQNQVAMLAHGDNVTYYYGALAYRQAMEAAVDGDVINLSGGVFDAESIKRVVTIRGAGFDTENPTIVVGDFGVDSQEEATERIYVEGVDFRGITRFFGEMYDPCFVKCKLEVDTGGGYGLHNVSFVNCQIRSAYMSDDAPATINYFNCYIGATTLAEASTATFINCMLKPWDNWPGNIWNSTLMNCIILMDEANDNSLPSSTTAKNCICVGSADTFRDVLNGENNVAGLDMSIFVDSNPDYDLTDAAKARYVGTDGTPVGMSGGYYPYNTKLSYPIISKFKVGDKVTDDNKLNVEVGVSQ